MKHRLVLILLFMLLQVNLYPQEVKSINTGDLRELLERSSDSIYVINFWATWCSPCVAEIGYFEELHRTFQDERVKVVLINLDFPDQLDKRVVPFMAEKDLSAPVYQMSDMDYNKWIPMVDREWTGTIPATLIFNRENRIFIPSEISKDKLFQTISQFLRN